MPRPLLLVAASGLAREVAEAARAGGDFEPIGFLDDNAGLHGAELGGLRVLGGVHDVLDHPDAALVLCAGKGAARQRIAERLADLGIGADRYTRVLHPSVSLPHSCSVGSGSIVLAGCVLTADVRVGEHVVVMPQVTLTHDTVVADFATLCASVTLGGGVEVGPRAYLGMAASVRENLRIGADALLGMGSVALIDVPAAQTWVGVPARSMGANLVQPDAAAPGGVR